MKTENTARQVIWIKTAIAVALVLVAAAVRIAPHPWNLTPIGAMALFSGAVFKEKWLKFGLPMAALFAGDALVGFHKLMPFVYLSFSLSVAIGMWLEEKRTVRRIAGTAAIGAAQFFVITNFAVWVAFDTYEKTLAGLGACYLAGLPLFWNTLIGDALYAGILFGGYALAERLAPDTRTAAELPG
jgi:hypothetical protein